jgi:hypothetical protein
MKKAIFYFLICTSLFFFCNTYNWYYGEKYMGFNMLDEGSNERKILCQDIENERIKCQQLWIHSEIKYNEILFGVSVSLLILTKYYVKFGTKSNG